MKPKLIEGEKQGEGHFDQYDNTFSKTYIKLIFEVEKLFIDNIDDLISKNFNHKQPHPNPVFVIRYRCEG